MIRVKEIQSNETGDVLETNQSGTQNIEVEEGFLYLQSYRKGRTEGFIVRGR